MPPTARVVVRATVVDEIVENTANIDVVAPGFHTALRLMEKSARPKPRSIAALSTPVQSNTALGVAKSRSVTSLMTERATPPLSSTASVLHPIPLDFAMTQSS